MKTKRPRIAHLIASSVVLFTMTSGLPKSVNAASETALTETSALTTDIELDQNSDNGRPIDLISYYVNQRFLLNNETSKTMTHFYASPSYVDSWEDDILGTDVLLTNESAWITIQDDRETCQYDFRAVFSNGTEATHYGINVCNLAEYTFN